MNNRIRHFFLRLVITLYGAAHLLALLAGLAYFLPISLQPFERPINRQLERQLGMQIRWNAGYIWVRRQQIVLRYLQFYRRGQVQPDFRIGRVLLQFDTLCGIDPAAQLRSVRLVNPAPVTLLLGAAGLQCDPPVHELVRAAAAAQARLPRDPAARSAQWPEILLFNGQFALGQSKAGKILPVCSLSQIELKCARKADGTLHAAYSGKVFEQDGREFRGEGSFDPDSSAGDFALTLKRCEALLPYGAGSIARAAVDGWWIRLRTNQSDGRREFALDSAAEQFGLQLPVPRLRLREAKPQLQIAAHYEAEDRRLRWDSLQYHSAASDFDSSGSLSFADGLQAEGAVRASRLNDCWRQLLSPEANAQLPPQTVEPAGWIELRGQYAGRSGSPPDYWAVLEVRNKRLMLPFLPEPVEKINGVVTLDRTRIECMELRANYGGEPLRISLSADTPLLGGAGGRAEAQWEMKTRLDRLSAIAIRAARILAGQPGMPLEHQMNEFELAGEAKFTGRISAARPDEPGPRDLSYAVNYALDLSNGRLSHPALPAPIEQIEGLIHGSARRIAIDDLRGNSQGLKVRIDGSLEGKKAIWDAPQLQLQMESELQLPQMLERYDAAPFELLRFYHPEGRVRCGLNFRGPALEPLELEASAYAELENVAIDSPFNWVLSRIEELNGRLELRPEVLRAENLTFRLGDLRLRANAFASLEELVLECALQAEIAQLPQILPIFLADFQLAGAVQGFSKFALRRNLAASAANPAQSAASRLKDLNRLWSAWAADLPVRPFPGEVEFSGRYELKDVTATPRVFPVAVTHVNGTVYCDGLRFHSDDLAGTIGSSTVKNGRMSVLLRKKNFPKIDVALKTPRLDLDEWITAWNPPLPHSGYFLENSLRTPWNAETFTTDTQDQDWKRALLSESRELEVNLQLNADHADWEQYAGSQLGGQLKFVGRNDAPNVLTVSDTQIDFYHGQLDYATTLTFPSKQPADYVMLFRPQGVDLTEFLSALTRKPELTKGQLFGTATIAGTFTKLETMTGSGECEIRNSQLFSIVFTELYKLLTFIPGYSKLSFSSIVAPFTIGEKKVHFDNLKFEGPLIDIQTRGAYHFDKTLDFLILIQINNPAPGLFDVIVVKQIMEFVGKAFSYHLHGTLDQPEYDYVPFSYVRSFF